MPEVSAMIPKHLMHDESEIKSKNAMGKDDFLKLLMTQLQHQDPLKPMDHQQFSAQLAQFSQLEQLGHIGKSIDGLRNDQGEGARIQALNLIGKRVQASANEVELISGQDVIYQPSLKEGMQITKALVMAPGGKIVREIEPSPDAAKNGIRWDGKDQEGNPLPSGKYSFRVHGVGSNGVAQEIQPELSGRVTGIELAGKTPMLVVETAGGAKKLELGKVSQVMVDEPSQSNPVKPVVTQPKVSIPVVKKEESDDSESEVAPVNESSESDPTQQAFKEPFRIGSLN